MQFTGVSTLVAVSLPPDQHNSCTRDTIINICTCGRVKVRDHRGGLLCPLFDEKLKRRWNRPPAPPPPVEALDLVVDREAALAFLESFAVGFGARGWWDEEAE